MTSINFNAAATTALRTLQQTNTALETSQNRVSTGLKIGEAKDNAAYWSISTTLKSDNKALGTVKDALGLGAATVDTAYQGLNKTLEVLDQIKVKLVAASQDGVDKTAIGDEIAELQKQLSSISASSAFSGENFLSVASANKSSATVVSGFTRTTTGVSIDTINIDFNGVALLDSDTSTGILDTVRTGSAKGFVSIDTAATPAGAAPATVSTTFAPADVITFTAKSGATGPDVLVTIDASTVRTALGIAAGSPALISTPAAAASVLNAAFKSAGVTGIAAEVSGVGVRFVSDKAFTIGTPVNSNGTTPADPANFGLVASTGVVSTSITTSSAAKDISVTASSTKLQLTAYVDIISAASSAVTSAAAKLGAISARIDLQTSFVNTLVDTIDKGVSGLIDADLSEESTKLQALQTKQQLGIQALSIANSSTQNILSLFRS